MVVLEGTLHALYYGEIDTLVLDAELMRKGYRCSYCGGLGTHTGPCDFCGHPMAEEVLDLEDELTEETLVHGGRVEVVARRTSFQKDGGVGALLRFRVDKS